MNNPADQKPELLLSFKVDIYDNGSYKLKQTCANGQEQAFAMLLAEMQTGKVQALLLDRMIHEAKNKADKDKANLILTLYNEINKQLLESVKAELIKNTPVVRPTEIFGKQLKKIRSK